MGKTLVPELHDIGKLYRIPDNLKATLGTEDNYLHEHELAVMDAWGISSPTTDSWRGVTQHHQQGPSTQLDLFVLAIADHAASSASRGLRQSRASPFQTSIHKLWNPGREESLAALLPECSYGEMHALTNWMNSDPDAEAFFSRYAIPLQHRPEELRPPLNTVSLASHCSMVGKVYRFLTARIVASSTNAGLAWSFAGQPSEFEPQRAENRWHLFLIRGTLSFPHFIARTRDMAVFDLMSEQMGRLASDDRVLVCTFDQFIALCSSREEIADLVAPAATAGLSVTWEAARTPITELRSSPSEMRAQLKSATAIDNERWWQNITAAWSKMSEETRCQREEERCRRKKALEETLVADYPRGSAIAELPHRIVPPICEICQLEPATRQWPDDPTDAGPFEDIGERCYALRQRAVRLVKLSAWTDEPSCRVMWVYIGLDLGRLVGFLEPLLIRYAKQRLNAQQLAEIDVRPPLLLEFQKDYVRFLQNWADALKDYAGEDNIEHVSGSGGLAGNSLLCLRLGGNLAIPELLKLYHQGIQRHFPVCLAPDLPTESAKSIPFRLYLGVSGVKFPFSEHWRMAQEDADLLVHIVGQGTMRAPLPSLPALVQMAHPANRTALHNLAKVAGISEALADLHIENRADRRHYRSYAVAMQAMRPFGMSHKDLIMFARILEG